VEFGKSTTLTPQFVSMSFKDVISICNMDIDNVFFTSLGQMIHQIVGAPMGGPPSPAYAICICPFYEHQFYHSVYDFLRLQNIQNVTDMFRFIRYVDDIFGIIVWDSRDITTFVLAKHIVQMLERTTYHPSMILKPEPTNGRFPFLEALINVPTQGTASIQFNNKNYPSIMLNGRPKTLTIQHRSSFMSAKQATTKIVGALHRLKSIVPSPGQRVFNTLEMFTVFAQQGYSIRDMRRALDCLFRSTDDATWKFASSLLQPMLKHLLPPSVLITPSPSGRVGGLD
jgi:hypothetical protein